METVKSKHRRKHGAEWNTDALPMRERLRHQWDALDLQRRVLENMDQSVRYALVIFGAVNTGVVLGLTRLPQLTIVPGAQTALRIVVLVYAFVAFSVLLVAMRLLRPGVSTSDLSGLRFDAAGRGYEQQVLLSLLPSEDGPASLDDLHAAWQRATGEQLSIELTELCILCSSMVATKSKLLRRLYASLGAMLPLAAIAAAGIGLVFAV